jgi:ornithine cyclodeaminase/alanine dehydrogenase-like protein (mu-crystallin family)
MRVVSAGEIDAALKPSLLADALAAAFRGSLTAPKRHHHAIERAAGDATLLLMPAWSAPHAGAAQPMMGVKVVTVFPDNSTRALPSVLGSYILMDGTSGQPLAVMDGTRLTLWRTAAASALAARHLAQADRRRMLMVGAGALCHFMIRAHAAEARLTDIAIWNHNPARAQAQVMALAGDGLPVRVAGDLATEARAADLITCATLSTSPLIKGDWLKPGCHVDLVGAFSMAMREADADALKSARLYVDTSAALSEGGDVAIGLRDNEILPGAIQGDLPGLCTGAAQGRGSPGEITLFKSIGAAIEDLAAAALVWSQLQA